MDEGVSAHFGDDGRAAVDAAHRIARELNVAEIGTDHLLLGVLENAPGGLHDMVSPYGLTAPAVRGRLIAGRPADPAVESPVFSAKVKTALNLAHREAHRDARRISCSDLFLSLMKLRDPAVIAFLRSRAEIDELFKAAYAHVEPLSRRTTL